MTGSILVPVCIEERESLFKIPYNVFGMSSSCLCDQIIPRIVSPYLHSFSTAAIPTEMKQRLIVLREIEGRSSTG
jgi:hypothetical protein